MRNSIIMWLLLSITCCIVCLSANAQSSQVAEQFGVHIDFSGEWTLLSEDLYSPLMQRQLFVSPDERVYIFLQRFPVLSELQKKEWRHGVPGNPLSMAEEVIEVDRQDWIFEIADFDSELPSAQYDGASVFMVDHALWKGYAVFVSRHGAYVQVNVTADKEKFEPTQKDLDEILAQIEFLPTIPPMPDDPFMDAERAHVLEKDSDRALKLYEQVPSSHPKYVDALRRIGFSILGKERYHWKEAIPYLEKAFELAPEDEDVLTDLGRAYLEIGQRDQGKALLEQAGTNAAEQALEALKDWP